MGIALVLGTFLLATTAIVFFAPIGVRIFPKILSLPSLKAFEFALVLGLILLLESTARGGVLRGEFEFFVSRAILPLLLDELQLFLGLFSVLPALLTLLGLGLPIGPVQVLQEQL